MEPVIVRAHLVEGYVAADPWSPALDGILAYWAVREQLGEEEFAATASGHGGAWIEPELPLERIAGPDGLYWWAASSPTSLGLVGRHESFRHRRFDDGDERWLPEKTGKVQTKAGPFKAYRDRELTVICAALEWACVGDAAGIERLLRRCTHVGAGGARGHGEVLQWEVLPGVEAEAARARTWRPLPVETAISVGAVGPVREWGVRPPGRDPRARALCVMPRGAWG